MGVADRADVLQIALRRQEHAARADDRLAEEGGDVSAPISAMAASSASAESHGTSAVPPASGPTPTLNASVPTMLVP